MLNNDRLDFIGHQNKGKVNLMKFTLPPNNDIKKTSDIKSAEGVWSKVNHCTSGTAREATKDEGLWKLCMNTLKRCIKQFTTDSHANATKNRMNMYTMEQEK